MEHLMFTLVTFILFTALVGVISAKIVKGGDDQKTAKGYFLAGSGLGGTFIAGSMLLTNLSAENLVGLSGQSYAANMSGMHGGNGCDCNHCHGLCIPSAVSDERLHHAS